MITRWHYWIDAVMITRWRHCLNSRCCNDHYVAVISQGGNDHLVSYVYSKQPILGLTQEWFRELSFSRLVCGVHKLHISSAVWWDILLPLA